MDRNRRDVGVASVFGGALVVATLAVGQVFGVTGSATVEGTGTSRDGGALVVAGGGSAGGSTAGRSAGRAYGDGGSGRSAGSSSGARSGSGAAGAGAADGGSSAADRRRGAGTSTGGGSGAVTSAEAGSGTSSTSGEDPRGDGSSIGGGVEPAPGGGSGDDGRGTTAAVRLDVTDLSVTGTDSGTLRSGSEVRVRLTTTRENVTTGADGVPRVGTDGDPGAGPGAATGAATGHDPADGSSGVGSAASGAADGLPGRLDVRLGLDDAAVAALDATAAGSTGPIALRALVDLVARPASSDGAGASGTPTGSDDGAATDPGRYVARIRLRLAPTEGARASVAAAPRTEDGVSNVVAVTTPIGTRSADDAPAAPSGDVDPAATVELRVPVPTGATSSAPEDGARVGVPIPDDDAPATGPSTADVAVVVHVPAAGEPLGGVPEDLTPTPDPGTDTPPATGPTPAPDGGPGSAGTDGGGAATDRPTNPVGDAARLLDQMTGALGTLLTSGGR